MKILFLLFVLMNTSLRAQEGTGQSPQAGGSIIGLVLPFIILIVFFYFILILPQQRREKKHREMLSSLKKGDRVVTTGGIYGAIHKLDEKTVVLKIGQNTLVKFDKNVIQRVLKEGSEKNE